MWHEKVTYERACELIKLGDKMNTSPEQLRILKSQMKIAKLWAGKVRKTGISNGDTNGVDVEELRAEMNDFCIDMQDEREMLNNATAGYCLCRKPYAGFMIGCDTCDEWYHGPCVAVSEHGAEKLAR